eukprot:m.13974 g.13974  ORF g.13974 m.13974 type:complete len:84 (-) comp10263_c0_seq1:712-963(-)
MAVTPRKKDIKPATETSSCSVRHTSKLEGKVRKIIGGGCAVSALVAGILNVAGSVDLDSIPVFGWSMWYGTGIMLYRMGQERI